MRGEAADVGHYASGVFETEVNVFEGGVVGGGGGGWPDADVVEAGVGEGFEDFEVDCVEDVVVECWDYGCALGEDLWVGFLVVRRGVGGGEC